MSRWGGEKAVADERQQGAFAPECHPAQITVLGTVVASPMVLDILEALTQGWDTQGPSVLPVRGADWRYWAQGYSHGVVCTGSWEVPGALGWCFCSHFLSPKPGWMM